MTSVSLTMTTNVEKIQLNIDLVRQNQLNPSEEKCYNYIKIVEEHS